MSSNEQYPARVEQFHAVAVTIYEIDGKDYLIGEDIGRCLGMSDPRKTVNKIYNRHQDELDGHSFVAKVSTNYPGNPQNRLFSETGANLIGMFSRTAKSKDFRLWLARLPRRVRDAAPAALDASYARGLEDGLNLVASLHGELLTPDELGQLIALRRLGFTQRDTAASLRISKDQLQEVEKGLKGVGITFPYANQITRRKNFRAALVAEIKGVKQIPPSPPLLKGGDKDHRRDACATGGGGVKELGHDAPAG